MFFFFKSTTDKTQTIYSDTAIESHTPFNPRRYASKNAVGIITPTPLETEIIKPLVGRSIDEKYEAHSTLTPEKNIEIKYSLIPTAAISRSL